MFLSDKVPTKLDRLSMFVNVYHHIPSLKWLFNIHTITHMVIGVYILVISLFLDHSKKNWEPFNNHRFRRHDQSVRPAQQGPWQEWLGVCTIQLYNFIDTSIATIYIYIYIHTYVYNIYIYAYLWMWNLISTIFLTNFIIWAIHISFVDSLGSNPRPLDS